MNSVCMHGCTSEYAMLIRNALILIFFIIVIIQLLFIIRVWLRLQIPYRGLKNDNSEVRWVDITYCSSRRLGIIISEFTALWLKNPIGLWDKVISAYCILLVVVVVSLYKKIQYLLIIPLFLLFDHWLKFKLHATKNKRDVAGRDLCFYQDYYQCRLGSLIVSVKMAPVLYRIQGIFGFYILQKYVIHLPFHN